MKLYTLLLMVHGGCNIIIFDQQGIEIFRARDKDSIPIELNDYDVLEISAGPKNLKTLESALYISLQK